MKTIARKIIKAAAGLAITLTIVQAGLLNVQNPMWHEAHMGLKGVAACYQMCPQQ
jgi:hypothetical protein